MNTRNLLAVTALAFGLTATAFAQEATIGSVYNFTDTASAVSRADVRAEAARALAAGELREIKQINPQNEIDSTLTREAVRAATAKALRRGSVADANAEAYRFG